MKTRYSGRGTLLRILLLLSGMSLLTSCPSGGSTDPEPEIVFFTVDGQSSNKTIQLGNDVKLSWEVKNSSECKLTSVDKNGNTTNDNVECILEKNFTPSLSTTYKLSARRPNGSFVAKEVTVTVQSGSGNQPPVASNDSIYSVVRGETLIIAAPGVLGNDSDPEEQTLTASLVSNVSEGTLDLNANGSFAYDASGVTANSVNFTYKVNDGQSDSNVATVTITITEEPVTPIRFERRILLGSDDTEELEGGSASGDMFNNSPDLDFGSDSGDSVKAIVGLRFTNITIPPDANIVNAWLQFTANDGGLINRDPRIEISLSTNVPVTFSTEPFTLTTLALAPVVPIIWEPEEWTVGEEQGDAQRVDITEFIQFAVDASSWEIGDSLGFVMKELGDGIRIALSLEGALEPETDDIDLAPTLIVEYTVP
jgi:Bacterial cadherin-like domain